ncbi:uncharacterized protein LOC117174980 isoform X2 [Belonocnema kinseyi]|uniref:uncharacterized protein LOC117174980 isoform X2 n=1 Tax=Belonocnema kinseyi TaxID=2817044 RepID=UPI00143CF701|nr:uncharacterized protein LOC117174980 isoform X2 [Belonocnema kinseyi]
MVMAGTEGVSGPAKDEPLSSRLQWLRQRREALQDKLAQKNTELKTLCIEEAELTGVLPPEIPLEPGQSPPIFRKRAGTSINYPQNLINKLKTNEAEESALELERQVQVGIKEAALTIINDSTESKAVRRKHRLVYQQSKQRLQEIDACLNFIRHSHGSTIRHTQVAQPLQNSQMLMQNSKHRTKKPRPPLDNCGRGERGAKLDARSLQDQGGISLSPLGPEHNYNLYSSEFQDLDSHQYIQPGTSNPNHNRTNYIAASPVDPRRANNKLIDHDSNINNNVYILPDQQRARTYSQGAHSASLRRQGGLYPDSERPYRPVPNTYTEEERHYRQLQLQKQDLQSPTYPEYRYLDNNDAQRRMAPTQYYETEYSSSRYEQTADYQYGKAPLRHRRERDQTSVVGSIDRRHHSALQPNMDSYLPPGHWMRLDDEIVWCPDEQPADRFGSLDRRKHSTLQYPNAEIQSRYHTVASGSKNIPILPRQHPVQVPVSPTEHTPSNRILLRTQSLGSVETWHQGHDLSDRDQTDLNRKGKEKEWYETALDSGCSPSTVSVSGSFAPTLTRKSSQNNPPPPPPPIPIPIREPVKVEPTINRRPRDLPLEEPQCLPISPNIYHERPKVLEIPAESNPSQENGNDPLMSFNSPTNHTVVQQGKYQPYREVTKPFEMSDFYKYSTKYRKRNEAASGVSPSSVIETITSHNPVNDQRRVSPVQTNNYQPSQRKPQPYVLRI